MINTVAIIPISESGFPLAEQIRNAVPYQVHIFSKEKHPDCERMTSMNEALEFIFPMYDAVVFIGALGICVRSISPYIGDKYSDPAVVNIDSTAKFVVSVLSGHIGGANSLTKELAGIVGGQAVISTQSDNTGLWALDMLGEEHGWITESKSNTNPPIIAFVKHCPTALLLDVDDDGTQFLERTCPKHVSVFYNYNEIPLEKFEVFIAVTPYCYESTIPTIYYRPRVLHVGVGCRKACKPEGIAEYIKEEMISNRLSPYAIHSISTIELKQEEPLMEVLCDTYDTTLHVYTANELEAIEVPNPSDKVKEVTDSYSVAEASALKSSGGGPLMLEKQKGKLSEGNDFTFAVAMDSKLLRGKGHIEIVGAGPGDPDLISVKGRHFLEQADLILYAGSLVPKELTHCAKSGAMVKSSADMTLEEQFALMKVFYDKGCFIVRLHTGDPCIYGAIQEQMAFFDQYKMDYHITPGISSFQAAAAALRSQFTIPEKVQTIILTRGEGRTPMPDKEKLSLLARSQSTMCIFLSAGVVEQVQHDLLEHYPPTTPVAACYHLTWKDERIYRGELKDLAEIVKTNNLTLTTMIVVGDAIDNRAGLSHLYSENFKHLFRE